MHASLVPGHDEGGAALCAARQPPDARRPTAPRLLFPLRPPGRGRAAGPVCRPAASCTASRRWSVDQLRGGIAVVLARGPLQAARSYVLGRPQLANLSCSTIASCRARRAGFQRMNANHELLRQVASGRRVINICMFSWLAAGVFHVTETPLGIFFLIGATVTALIGTKRVAEGLSLPTPMSWLTLVGSAIPLAGLLVMGWLSARAAKALRSADYQVGMFQSSKSREA